MATKRKIQASEVEVGNRTVEAILLDLAERSTRALEEIEKLRRQTDASLAHLSALTRDHMTLAGRVDAFEKAS